MATKIRGGVIMLAIDHVVLDYGLGNANSIASCLRSIGCHVITSRDPEQLRLAKVIYIPGVGSFQEAVERLQKWDLISTLNEIHRQQSTLFVGMCLGMQLFADASQENGLTKGLGWIPGTVKPLSDTVDDRRLPHIGWNQPLIQDSSVDFKADYEPVYFDHGFYFDTEPENVLAYCEYGACFPAIVAKGRVVGFQFHPEKSQMSGKKLLAAVLNHFSIPRNPVWITEE